jgi:hypothetical protein
MIVSKRQYRPVWHGFWGLAQIYGNACGAMLVPQIGGLPVDSLRTILTPCPTNRKTSH